MGCAVCLQPLVGRDLVRTELGSDPVVQYLGGRAGQGPQPGLLRPPQVVGQRFAQPPGTFGDLQGGEAVDVDVGDCFADGPGDGDVVVAVEGGMDSTLQADLGSPHPGGLGGP